MTPKKRIVIPGEEVAASEEFLSGEGTFEVEGKIFAAWTGDLNLDSNEMIAKVAPKNPLAVIKIGDSVIGHVTETRDKMVVVDVAIIEGYTRELTGEKLGTIHVSKISSDYTSDVRKEMRLGDIIRAEVIQVKPSLQLTTAEPDLGVIKARCIRCRGDLKKERGDLFCPNCQRREQRKIARDYGQPMIKGMERLDSKK